MRRRKNFGNNSKLMSIILVLVGFLYVINDSFGFIYEDSFDGIDDRIKTEDVVSLGEDLSVHYIDVGQADSILIERNQEYMLIDGGNNVDGPLLVDYFKDLGITSFKYLVATHPHEDHIGGLDDVIDNFDIGTIYMPDVITTSKTFEDLLDSIENKNLTFNVPVIGSSFKLGDSDFTVIYTGMDTSDLNNTSIVLRMVYGNTSFLFTGDATDVTEEKIINQNIQTDVLKVGHHGSKYSTTDKFLAKVNPKYAVISVGSDNKYGHPASSTINKLNSANIETYRTDQDGTVIAESDGNDIKFSTVKTNTNGGLG